MKGENTMNITRETLLKLCKDYGITIMDCDDMENAMWFCYDLLNAEASATREKEPYATRSIDRMESAAHELFMLINDAVDLYENEEE